MGIRDILVTGRAAKLPGDWSPRSGGGCGDTSTDQRASVTHAEPATGREIVLHLPWPPSINSYWHLGANPKTRQRMLVVSAAGKRFTKRVAVSVRAQFRYATIQTRVSVLVEAWAPTHGRFDNDGWDVDNRLKPLLDALTKAQVWVDDKQVRDVRIVDCGRHPEGRVTVTVWPLRK